MTNERRRVQRYDLSLPLIIRVSLEKEASLREGKIRDISSRGVYFISDQEMNVGAEVDLTITLPAEVTGGAKVLIRAKGKVLRLENTKECGLAQVGVAAVIELYEFMRNVPDGL